MSEDFTTHIGSRIHDLRNIPHVKVGPAKVGIKVYFYGEEKILVTPKDSNCLTDDSFHFPPKEFAPGSADWTDLTWADFFDHFKEAHQGHLPNLIVVEFHTGWGPIYEEYNVCFLPTGEIRYIRFRTNGGKAYSHQEQRYKTFVDPTDECNLTTLDDLKTYAMSKGQKDPHP